MTNKQLYFDGTEPPPDPVKTPELDDLLERWLAAKDKQRIAADATKIRHASLVEALTAAGIARYPYVDAATGRKKYAVADRTPKMKTITAPSARETKRKADAAKGDSEDKIEARRVKRASVEGEIDPFGSTRKEMRP